MTVYLLYATGITATPVIGIYSTKEQAAQAAAETWPKTDGYHRPFVVEEYTLDETPELRYPLAGRVELLGWRKDTAEVPLEYR